MAPLAQLSSALSSGQSDTASEPSFIASVSRLGLATEPEFEMIAPDHDRRLQLALRHHLVEREAEAMAVAEPDPADARRQALELDARLAMSSQLCRCVSCGISSFTFASVR